MGISKNEENWIAKYHALKQWTLEHGHFPNRAKIEGRGLLNWYKYNAKLIKQGKLSPEREQMVHELEEMRSGEHTGGRRKAVHDPSCLRQASQGPSATGSGQV